MISLMWNLRNTTEDHKRREEKIKQDEIRKGETLNHRKQTEGSWRGRSWRDGVNWVMDIKEGM